MTQEQKDLLLKDLCTRLPYGVKVYRLGNHKHSLYKPEVIDAVNYEICMTSQGPYMDNSPFMTKYAEIEEVKPYLFPLSSMTEEQKEDMIKSSCGIGSDKNVFDWWNKNHFDYRGLIPMGLAIDATGLNIY